MALAGKRLSLDALVEAEDEPEELLVRLPFVHVLVSTHRRAFHKKGAHAFELWNSCRASRERIVLVGTRN